ncbi:hypothetical protein [Azospirillum soli]|uniref:hypothetical protein n=1 Tax=Azospirillum soli TaxID=1304799 RepID=UPI001AE4C160|nr:hypothetical protein [Azospirillum soli]MBP2315550.1 hypothetical protein [Azospirillum soli]
MLGDEEVRAIFVGGQPERGGYTAAAAVVLTEPGRDHPYSTLVWPLADADAEPSGPVPDGFNQAEAERQLSDLVRLVVAYRMTRRGQPEETVPHTRPEILAADRNWRAEAKMTSLFRVADLRAPADRFGRASTRPASEASWRLGWRSTVSPHFRWQAHGPQWSLRRLMWIKAHERGPRGAPRKAEIETLR